MNFSIDFEVISYVIMISVSYGSLMFLARRFFRPDCTFVYILTWLFLTCIMGLTYGAADLPMYARMYDATQYFHLEYLGDRSAAVWYGYHFDIGYTILNKIGIFLGLSFSEFRFFAAGVFSLILLIVVRALTTNLLGTVIFFALYIIYPMWDDLGQVRNAYVELIVLFSLCVWTYSQRLSVVKYTLLVFLGTTIHTIAYIFLPIAFLHELKRYKIFSSVMKVLFYFGLFVPVLAGSIKNAIPDIAMFAANAVGLPEAVAGHYVGYLSFGMNMRFGWLITYSYCLIAYVMVRKIRQIYFLRKEVCQTSDIYERFGSIVETVAQYMIILAPLYILAPDMARIPRDVLVVYYAFFVASIPYLRKKERMVYAVPTVACGIIIGCVDFFTTANNSSLIFYDVMENNYILDIFNMFP